MPVTITLSDPHFQYIVQVVQERPYREAAPVINELFRQAQGQGQLALKPAGNGTAAAKEE